MIVLLKSIAQLFHQYRVSALLKWFIRVCVERYLERIKSRANDSPLAETVSTRALFPSSPKRGSIADDISPDVTLQMEVDGTVMNTFHQILCTIQK